MERRDFLVECSDDVRLVIRRIAGDTADDELIKNVNELNTNAAFSRAETIKEDDPDELKRIAAQFFMNYIRLARGTGSKE